MNLKLRFFSICFTVISSGVCSVAPSFAEAEKAKEKGGVQSGDIEIEETQEVRQSPFATAARDSLKWARELPGAVTSQGAIPVLEGPALVYVAASYVYCVRKLGNCAFILDAVLETDILAARGRGDNKCPVMGKFWRSWLDNDMESRLKLDIPIGYVNTITSFNQKERPKYVRCEDAVATALKDPNHSASATLNVKKTKGYLEEIESKSIDLFGAVGISTAPSRPSGKGR